MQNVKKLSRTAAAFLLAALILICSTVLPNTGTTVSAASAELTSIGLAEHALKAYRDGWQYSFYSLQLYVLWNVPSFSKGNRSTENLRCY